MSKVQAVLFDRRYYSSIDARKWLKDHDFSPIKRVDKTTNYLRYRIRNPQQFNRFITKKIKNNMRLVIGF